MCNQELIKVYAKWRVNTPLFGINTFEGHIGYIVVTFSADSLLCLFNHLKSCGLFQGFTGPVGPEGMMGPMGKPVRLSVCVSTCV